MLLEYYGLRGNPVKVAAGAYCASHDLYGVWPWNIYAASQHGMLGFLACFDSWDAPCSLLQAGMPLVASIRYGKGELTDAALEREDEKPLGHLVVIRGVEGGRVLVNDPAAASAVRSYDLGAFSRIWLGRSALGYVFPRPSS